MSLSARLARYDCARGHVVTIAQCEHDPHTGESLHCGAPVTMHAHDARRIDREIGSRTAAYHAELVSRGLPVGQGTAYGACSSACSHGVAIVRSPFTRAALSNSLPAKDYTNNDSR